MRQIILASTSPQRRALLALLGLPFAVIAPTCEERESPHLSPAEQAQQFARDKAQSIAIHYPDDLVVGSDTLIQYHEALLGKPKDLTEADSMLRQLRGRCHQVHTGVMLIQKVTNTSVAFVETALVWVKNFDDEERRAYLQTEESLGKAGAYSLQGEGARLIEKIAGDYPTIVGLPLWRTAKVLEEQGIEFPCSVEDVYRVKPYANWKDFT